MNVPELIGVLLLVVIVVVVLSIIIFRGGSWGSSTIPSIIDQWFGAATSPEEKTLIEAMSCAYYRCTEGCNSGLVKTAIWEDENGDKVSCLESFCKDEWRDSDGKICDDNAKAHPVEVSVSNPITLTPGGFFKAIKLVSECKKSAGLSGNVYVDEKLKEGFCDKNSCEMKATQYFIWTENGWFGSNACILCSSSS
jgi:hypothetical protein